MDYLVLDIIASYFHSPFFVSILRKIFNITLDKKLELELKFKYWIRKKKFQTKRQIFSIFYIWYLDDLHFSFRCLSCKKPIFNHHNFHFVFGQKYFTYSFCSKCFKNGLWTYYKSYGRNPNIQYPHDLTISKLSQQEEVALSKKRFPMFYNSMIRHRYKIF